MKFSSRFREWCPESGKKADLMFVQHMLASLKPNGRMATIMPHGVRRRCADIHGKRVMVGPRAGGDEILGALSCGDHARPPCARTRN